jgi:hypothetical protein
VVAVESTSGDVSRHVGERYARFLSRRPADFTIEVGLCGEVLSDEFLGLSTGEPFDVSRERIGGGLAESIHAGSRPAVHTEGSRDVFRRSDFTAVVDWSGRWARGVFRRGVIPVALECLLRVVYSSLAVERGGVLLHAAGVRRRGRGIIFPGRSGTGKSTIVGLASGEEEVLSDEILLVVKEGRSYRVWGTPFYGTNEQAVADRSAILWGIFLPVKDVRVRIEKTSPRTCLTRWLASVIFFRRDADSNERLLGAGEDIVRRVPFYTLHFRKDDEFWRRIRSLADSEGS